MIVLQKTKKTFPETYPQAILSKYTLSVPCNNGWIFYNTRSGSVIWSNKQSLNSEDVVLRRNGFVIPENYDETQFARDEFIFAASHSDTLELTLQTTLDCTCRCVYCYQGGDKPANCFMGENELNFLKSWIVSKLKDYKKLHINWFGGEPLLNYSAILNFSAQMIRICAKSGCDYYSGVVTNGILLTPQLIQQLIKDAWVRSFTITLDGPHEIHDQRRIKKNGGGTFDDICRSIDNLLLSPDAHIMLRIQIDRENLKYMPELFSFIQQKKWFLSPNIKLTFVRTKSRTSACTFSDESVLDQCSWGNVDEILFDLCRKYSIPRQNALPKSPSGGCQNKHFYVFNPKGDIFPCHALASGTPMTKEEEDLWKSWLPWENNPDCAECVLFPLCQGGCPFNTLHESDALVAELPCPDWRFSLEQHLCRWGKNKLEKGEFFT